MSKTRFGFVLAVAAVSGFVGGAVVPWLTTPQSAMAQDSQSKKKKKKKIVKAHKIQLIDNDGTVLAELSSGDDREMGKKVTLSLFDRSGKSRVRLFAADRATGLEFSDSSGNDRIVLSENSVGAGGSSRIQLLLKDSGGASRVKFDLSTFGAMTALIVNSSGAGIELVASVFKEVPLFRVVRRGGSEVWKAE
ncbi:MAG: hypothetical protein O7F76_06545 [Planctomycetota bacterium]|nr:hypothetical protein [Planctomycetota bacterium]MCZ6816345.1 hypothetical protein [Planctomycetota bacterium]